MPAYDYCCQNEGCAVVQELVQSIHTPLPESLPCPRCKGDSLHVFLIAPGIMTQGMTHQTLDIAIGRDAEVRWGRINERQALRDKIRHDSGKSSLTAVGINQYEATDKKLTAVVTPEPTED
jgi:putative FmdB family regulatory protein